MQRPMESYMEVKRKIAQWMCDHILQVILLILLLSYMFTYLTNRAENPIRSDGVGYYAYLPSLFIYADLSFEQLSKERFDGDIPRWTGIIRNPETGRYSVMYNCGAAVLMSPFFLAAHAATLFFNFPYFELTPANPLKLQYETNGFSLLYQHAAGLSGLLYMFAGLVILYRLLQKYFTRETACVTVGVLLLGTNLLYYASGQTVLSHPYSFFLLSAFIALLPRWYERPGRILLSMLMGAVLGCLPLVRTPNALFCLLLPGYGLFYAGSPARLWHFAVRHRRSLLAAAITAILVFSPQLMLWKYTNGRWFSNSYAALYPDMKLLNPFAPRLIDALFSLRGGILFWTPLTAVAVVGFFMMQGEIRRWRWPIALCVTAQLYLIASWHDWAFGGGFGHRGFVDILALLSLPLAAFVHGAQCSRCAKLMAVLIALCIMWNLFFLSLYYTRELSYYGLDRQALFDIFWVRKEALRLLFE